MFNIKNLAKRATGQTLPAAAGGVVSVLANKVKPGALNSKIWGAIKIGASAILPELSPKTKMLESAGQGLAGHAAGELFAEMFPALAAPKAATAGIGNDAEYIIDEDKIKGPEDEETLGTIDDDPLG